MSKKDMELALLSPDTEIITCSVCDKLIWTHSVLNPISSRMSLPSRASGQTVTQALEMMRQAADDLHHQTVVIPAEEACREHMEKRHRLRLWLWDRYGWDRVLRRWLV